MNTAFHNSQKSLFLVRFSTELGEGTILKQATTKDEAIRLAKLQSAWRLIDCVKAFVIKVQRPLITACNEPKLLIYSEDGQIPPTMVPVSSDLGEALGKRMKAHFICTVNDGNFFVHREIQKE